MLEKQNFKFKFGATINSATLCIFLAGCGPAYDGDRRYPLSGAASFDGQPIDLGSITLIPTDGDTKYHSGGVITDGKYSIPEEKGPRSGKYRVEVHWLKRTGKRIIDRERREM